VRGGGLARATDNSVKDYFERVAKYVPSEVLAAYLTLVGVIANAPMPRRLWLDLVSFLVGLVMTPIYLAKMADKNEPKRLHLVIASVAFVVWSYSLKGIFEDLRWYESITASVALVLFSLISGAFYPTVPAVQSQNPEGEKPLGSPKN
jgi:hypothetical protein